MPPINPMDLLNCLSDLLNECGGVRDEEQASRLCSLMAKFSKTMVNKVVYLMILKASDLNLTIMVMNYGGWNLMYKWLLQAVEAKNIDLAVAILEVIAITPVTVDRLKSNALPRLVKHLSKDNTNPDMKNLACDIVKKWLTLVKSNMPCSSPSTAPAVTKGKEERPPPPIVSEEKMDVEVEDEGDGEGKESEEDSASDYETRKSSEDKLKITVRRKKGRSQIEKEAMKDGKKRKEGREEKFEKLKRVREGAGKKREKKEKDKEKPSVEQSAKPEQLKAMGTYKVPTGLQSYKIPKRAKEVEDGKVESQQDKGKGKKSVPVKKPVSISIEKRALDEEKPKTVKTYNSKFRSTGLEQDVPLPRKACKSNKSSDKKTPSKRPSSSSSQEPSEKKIKSPPEVAAEEQKGSKAANKRPERRMRPNENQNQIKIVRGMETKRFGLKQNVFQESNLFMETIVHAINEKETGRRRKKSLTKDKPDASDAGGNKNLASESHTLQQIETNAKPQKEEEKTPEKPIISFYTRQVSEEEEKPEGNSGLEEGGQDEAKSQSLENEGEEMMKIVEEEKELVPLKGVLTHYKCPTRIKKSVRFKPDSTLEDFRYFEIDISERVNVSKTFVDMQMMERCNERQFLLMGRNTEVNDKMKEEIAWGPLSEVDVPQECRKIERGCNSEEKARQEQRKLSTPEVVYNNLSMIPDSPAEPPTLADMYKTSIPANIPLDDLTGSENSVTDFTDPKMASNTNASKSQLDAAAGNVFAAMVGGQFAIPPPMPFAVPPPFATTPNWTPPPNWRPPILPPNIAGIPPLGLMPPPPLGPPQFPPPGGVMGPPLNFPFPPNFPPPGVVFPNNATTSTSSTGQQGNSNGYTSNNNNSSHWNTSNNKSGRKDHQKSNYDNRNPKLCRYFQSKGYCSSKTCRFYHPNSK